MEFSSKVSATKYNHKDKFYTNFKDAVFIPTPFHGFLILLWYLSPEAHLWDEVKPPAQNLHETPTLNTVAYESKVIVLFVILS